MSGRVGHPSGGIGGLTAEPYKCFVICHASGASLCSPCQNWGGALMASIRSVVKIDFGSCASRLLTFCMACRVAPARGGSQEPPPDQPWPPPDFGGRNYVRFCRRGAHKKNGPPTPSQPMAGRGPAWKVRPNTCMYCLPQKGFMEYCPPVRKSSVSRARNHRLR